MDSVDQAILTYLTTKEVVSWDAMRRDIQISEEETEKHLSPISPLVGKDYVQIIRPVGNPPFVTITNRGRKALWTRNKSMIRFIVENWLVIVGTVAAIVAAITGIISIVVAWKNF